MSKITINGNTIAGNLSSGDIVIQNGKVVIGGVDVTPDAKIINIEVHGNVETLRADVVNKLKVNGVAGSVSTTSGDVDVEGDIGGSVNTMSGDVTANQINGNVKTMSGDIKAKTINNAKFD